MAIIVKSQKELDMIPLDTEDYIVIKFGTSESPAIIRNRYKYRVAVRENSFVVASENSRVVAFDNSRVVARGNSRVVAHENSSVGAHENSSIAAHDDSSIKAFDNSSIIAFDNSSVEAHDFSSVEAFGYGSVEAFGNSVIAAWSYSSVEAWGNSSVEAWGNSSVVTHGNSHVVARGNSHVITHGCNSVEAHGESYIIANYHSAVYAYENSYVVAYAASSINAFGNAHVLDWQNGASINLFENASGVSMVKNTKDFMSFYNIEHDETTAIFYKAVHKKAVDGHYAYVSDYDKEFVYEIGKKAFSTAFDYNPVNACGEGIHFSNMSWALEYGKNWAMDLAILEVRVKIKDILVPICTYGKVRAPEVEVIREVPLEECGTLGKILLQRRKNMKGNDDD